MIRLFSVDQGSELDVYKCSRKLTSAQFIPFREANVPGIIALPQRSLNFLYFQIDEGQGRSLLSVPQSKSIMGRRLSDNSGSDANFSGTETLSQPNHEGPGSTSKPLGATKSGNSRLNLRMVEIKNELVAPKMQMTSAEGYANNEAFSIRLSATDEGDPVSDKIQVISVTSFSDIRIMTL